MQLRSPQLAPHATSLYLAVILAACAPTVRERRSAARYPAKVVVRQDKSSSFIRRRSQCSESTHPRPRRRGTASLRRTGTFAKWTSCATPPLSPTTGWCAIGSSPRRCGRPDPPECPHTTGVGIRAAPSHRFVSSLAALRSARPRRPCLRLTESARLARRACHGLAPNRSRRVGLGAADSDGLRSGQSASREPDALPEAGRRRAAAGADATAVRGNPASRDRAGLCDRVLGQPHRAVDENSGSRREGTDSAWQARFLDVGGNGTRNKILPRAVATCEAVPRTSGDTKPRHRGLGPGLHDASSLRPFQLPVRADCSPHLSM